MVLADPSLIGQTRTVWITADDEVDMLVKGHFDRDAPKSERLALKQLWAAEAWSKRAVAVLRLERYDDGEGTPCGLCHGDGPQATSACAPTSG